MEVLLGELTFATALPAFATSAIAAFTARLVIPDEVLYHVPAMHMSPSLLVWALVVGPLLGFAGVGFVKLTNRLQGMAPKGWHLLVVLPVCSRWSASSRCRSRRSSGTAGHSGSWR